MGAQDKTERNRAGAGSLGVAVHASLAAAEPAWRLLQTSGVAYGFQTFEWLSAWLALYAESKAVQPAIVEVRQDDRPVMLVPLCAVSEDGLRFVSFLGGWLTDYHAPLLDPDFARGLTRADFLALWERIRPLLPQADAIHFWRMPEHVEGVPNPFIWLPGARANQTSYYSALPRSYEDYERSRGDSFLRKSRRRKRRLGQFGPVSYRVAETREERERFMDVLIRQKSRRHLETGPDPYAADPLRRKFYEALAHTGVDEPRGFVAALSVGETIIAAEWGFIFRKRFLDIIPSFEGGEWPRYSPGLVMKAEIIRWCIEQGMEVFDLTVGDEAYKEKWTDLTMPCFAVLRPLTRRGRAHWARVQLRMLVRTLLRPAWRWLKARLKGRKPVADPRQERPEREEREEP